MKGFLCVILLLLTFFCFGCKKAALAPMGDDVNTESLTVAEADALLADPSQAAASSFEGVSLTAASGVVINTEAGPLVIPKDESADLTVDTPDDKAIQTVLKNLNFYEGKIDGKIGPKTKEAIKKFQSANNLTADGKVGPKTWAVLRDKVESSK